MGLKSEGIGRHYLVMDDDALAGSHMAALLHKLGASRIDVIDNGEVALSYIGGEEKAPEIIICDLNMPQMDGIAFLRHLAAKQFTGGLVLVSSSDKRILRMAANLAQAHHLNILGYLQKPSALADLQGILSGFKGAKAMLPHLSSSLTTPEALRAAIEQDQLVPFFQPQVDVKTGRLVGVEALARWRHPERGIIPPALFIPVAEQHGLINLLTRSILIKTLRQAALWRAQGLNISYAVNFSVLSLSEVSIPDHLEAELRATGIDPSCLILEITESCLPENMTSTMEILLRLHLKGVRLSIDDFGTGHSSLEQLHRIPFSELKIDRIFVNGAAHDDEACAFLQSAVTLARKLNLTTVAEGVETQDDWDICGKLDCDVIQGFLVARPMPVEEFWVWNNRWQEQFVRKNAAKEQSLGGPDFAQSSGV